MARSLLPSKIAPFLGTAAGTTSVDEVESSSGEEDNDPLSSIRTEGRSRLRSTYVATHLMPTLATVRAS